jgi:hypothetical protein
MTIHQKIEAIILALLSHAHSQGRNKMLRTELLKHLYLLDVYTAESNAGKETLTNLEWRFHHYGPFSFQAAEILDDLGTRNILTEEFIEGGSLGDKEYRLYSLAGHSYTTSLTELGVSEPIKLLLSSTMKRCDNLSSLLDYVYFHTTPMMDAKPGDILDFRDCKKLEYADFKTIEMKPLNKKKLAENKRRLQDLMAQKKSQNQLKFLGVYDEIYHQSMQALESDPIETGITGNAILNIK